jgi:hypothetical protein
VFDNHGARYGTGVIVVIFVVVKTHSCAEILRKTFEERRQRFIIILILILRIVFS